MTSSITSYLVILSLPIKYFERLYLKMLYENELSFTVLA